MKERFLAELRRAVPRDGVENLIAYLEKSDFFTHQYTATQNRF